MPRPDRHSSTLHGDLEALFERAKLPSSPAIATQILALINDPMSSAQQFAMVISADPALAARVLKMSNAAAYAQVNQVTTIQRAVTVLGLRQIRLIALGFELVGHLDRLGGCPFDLPRFWQQSVLRGCVSREIARRVVPALAEEAFVVGLLQDCGILVLVQLLGADYARLYDADVLTPTAFLAAEKRSFPHTHVDAIRTLASMWRLPESIAMPLGHHHRRVRIGGKSPDHVKLAAVAYFAGALRFVEGARPAPAEPSLDAYAREELGLDQETLDACLAASEEAYRQVGEVFHDTLPGSPDVAELLLEANRQLQSEVRQQEQRVRVVEAERDQILDEQQTLRHALGQYREQAARDPLTGLLNRQALVDATSDCMTTCRRRGAAILVMFLDIDDFKQINDHHGHQAGDLVLRSLAVALNDDIGEDGIVGRYGGEEFVVVMPGLDLDAARHRSNQLLEAIRRLGGSGIDLDSDVTCSIGAIWCEHPGFAVADALFAAADGLMYQAKRTGKDRCCFEALRGGAAPAGEQCGEGASFTRAEVEADVTEAQFRAAAEELDRHDRPPLVSARKQERTVLLTPCVLRYLLGPSVAEQSEWAYVRNVSTGGVGVLTARPLVRGDLVEVALEVEGEPVHLAGLVAYCRVADGPIHEVGIQLFQRSSTPILSAEVGAGIQALRWVSPRLKRQAMGDAA